MRAPGITACCLSDEGPTHLHVRSPQGQVVPKQLHDERAVLVRLLAEGVQLGNGLVEGLRAFPGSEAGFASADTSSRVSKTRVSELPRTNGSSVRLKGEEGLACMRKTPTCLARWHARSGEFRIS